MERPDRPRTHRAGTWIFREGDHGESAYLVTRGRVRISTRRGGAERTLAEIGAGDVFGEVALIDAGPRSAVTI